MALFKKRVTVTPRDVLILIEAIRAGADPVVEGYLDDIDSNPKQNLAVVAEGLCIFGGALIDKHDLVTLEPVVTTMLNRPPKPRSAGATAAVNELGRAIFLHGDPDTVVQIYVRLVNSPNLTDPEKSQLLLECLFAAGWIAQSVGNPTMKK
jgi:hypothetical protein